MILYHWFLNTYMQILVYGDDDDCGENDSLRMRNRVEAPPSPLNQFTSAPMSPRVIFEV